MRQHHTSGKSVSLLSLGAAETVTGSKHLLKTPELNILIDCGLFQGIKSLRQKNWESLSVNPADIDVVILTHAHLDHSGYIPLLIKRGFKGKVYMTEPTRELTELILLDSAKIQMEDAERANQMHYSKHHPALPLYDTFDAEASFNHFKTVKPNTRIKLNEQVDFQFTPSGHILGAASCDINCYGKTLVFSGDIGRYDSEFMNPPQHIQKADFVIMESTYGDRLHEEEDPKEILARVINETIVVGGNILISSFAIGRAQEIMFLLHELKTAGRIPETIPVYLDSPMAATATDILLRYPEWIKISKHLCIEMCDGVRINRDYHDTASIIAEKRSKIIIAASGMLTGGRVLEYLKHYVSTPENTIFILGFQAEGTRGRALLNKAHEIKVHGKFYPVYARVEEITSLSAHADQRGLLKWLKAFNPAPQKVLLVHGEPSAQEALRVKIQSELDLSVQIPKQNEAVFLFKPDDSYL